MTSLAEHWDGAHLQAGWHQVQVVEHRLFKANTGNNGVEFQFQSIESGGKAKEGFMLLDNCLWKLAALAKACGFTREQAAEYDPYNQNHHRKFHGMECWVEMVKDGKYHRVERFRSLTEGRGTDSAPVETMKEASEAEAAKQRDDDIPF
ncbi:MAG: hypothetical protein O7D91_17585 [Planctomycetota bacterium]|nr:hypothetical protein [Planctomycetota bacterium]